MKPRFIIINNVFINLAQVSYMRLSYGNILIVLNNGKEIMVEDEYTSKVWKKLEIELMNL